MTSLTQALQLKSRYMTCPLLLTSLLLVSGCATMIPETDSTPPEIRLTFSGGGIGAREMSNPPRINWTAPDGTQYLDFVEGVRYNFIFSVSDEGGVRRAHLRMPEFAEITDLAPEGTRESTSGVTRVLELRGDRGDPRTGLVITGKVSFPSGNYPFEFQAEADDFGGRRGLVNQTFMNVSSFVD